MKLFHIVLHIVIIMITKDLPFLQKLQFLAFEDLGTPSGVTHPQGLPQTLTRAGADLV